MALVVEDGTVVADADTYVTRAAFITFAAAIGVTIASDAATDVFLVKAFQYINNLEPRLKGTRTARANPNAYPRDGLIIEGFSWTSVEVPRQAILAQQYLALDLNAGIDIYNRPQSASTAVKRVRVEGAVEKENAVSDSMKTISITPTMALVNSLLKDSGFTIALDRG